MNIFWRGIAKVLFYVISGALLVYASSRSLDFINGTLSGNNQFVGLLALAATSGGMIAWLLMFLYAADGLGQKITAGIMVVIDLLGEFTLFTIDTLYQSGMNGITAKMAADEVQMVVLGMSGLIAINIAATVAFHLVEPENIRNMREGFVRDKLENEALKQIEKHGEEIARTLAPQLAEQWREDFEARFSDMKSLGLGKANKKVEEKPQPQQAHTIPLFSLFNRDKAAGAEAAPLVPLAQPLPGNDLDAPAKKNGNHH